MSFSPSSAELAEILSHIRYEIEHAFITPEHDVTDRHIREAVFLAMQIHAHFLLEFFEHKARYKDSVLCRDFGFPASPVDVSVTERMRLNKDMARLTYSRLRHASDVKLGPVLEVLRPLARRTIAFIEHILAAPPGGVDATELDHWRGLLKILKGKG